jgi:putative hemolysin
VIKARENYMGLIGLEIVFIFVLIVINGLFSMSELAVVSARPVRLKKSAGEGGRGAQAALDLAEKPDNFLSTVQIGITLVGILTGAFGGATLAEHLALYIDLIPILAPYSAGLSFTLVVGTITYFTIILGELIPKSLALNSPETIASIVSRPMKVLSALASPVVWLLSAPTSYVLRLFKVHASVEPPVTDEEIKSLIDVGTKAGVFEETEQDLIESVIHLGDRRLTSLMTPRTRIAWLNINDTPGRIREKLIDSNFSRLPVCEGSLDAVVGYTSAKALLKHLLKENELDPLAAFLQPLYVPETNTVLELLEQFKEAHTHFALVIDEFGGVEGLVTMNDVLEAIVGELSNSQHNAPQKGIELLENGAWLLDGQLSIIELKAALGLGELPYKESMRYHTLAGFVMTQLGKLPGVGEKFEWNGFIFEVAAMELNRVDKVVVTHLSSETDFQS